MKKAKVEAITPEDSKKCKNGKLHIDIKPHGCPYREEISDDHTKCRCCKACEEDCAADI